MWIKLKTFGFICPYKTDTVILYMGVGNSKMTNFALDKHSIDYIRNMNTYTIVHNFHTHRPTQSLSP